MARTAQTARRSSAGKVPPPRGPRKRPVAARSWQPPAKGSHLQTPGIEVPEWIGDELQVWDDSRFSSIIDGQKVTVQRKGHLEMQPSKCFTIKCTNFYKAVAIVGFPPSRREDKWHVVGRLNAKFIKDDGNPEGVRELLRGTLVSFWVEHVAQ